MSELKSVQLDFINLAIVHQIVDEDGVAVNVAGTSVKNILLKKPVTGTVVTKAATLYTDGTDGKIQYLTIANDLNEVGVWETQADTTEAGWDGTAEIKRFKVLRNLV